MEQFAPAVGPTTSILPVINGMSHLDRLSARFGAQRVLGGVAVIMATLDGDGRVVQLQPVHELVFGEQTGGFSDRSRAVSDVLVGAGFDARASDAVMQDMWDKWAGLAAIAGITCLMRAAIGDIVAAPGGSEAILRLFAECCAVAAASGFALNPTTIERWRGTLTTPGSPNKASMLRDIERGGPTEGDHVLGDLAIRARTLGVATPMLDLARTHVAAYEIRRAREAAVA
jgi:2-dehydropantoate 2-reductase